MGAEQVAMRSLALLALLVATARAEPPREALFGCGGQRSRADWTLRQRSLTIEAIDGAPAAVWVVDTTQLFDPKVFGGSGEVRVTRATAIVVCRGGERPACAVVHGDRRLTREALGRDVAIRWPP
jgi:hypothetical protein